MRKVILFTMLFVISLYTAVADLSVGLQHYLPMESVAFDDMVVDGNCDLPTSSLTQGCGVGGINGNMCIFEKGLFNKVIYNNSNCFSRTTNNAFSGSFWFKPEALATGQIFSRMNINENWNAEWSLYQLADGTFDFYTSPDGSIGESLVSTTVYNAGQWYYIAFTFDGYYKRLYVNGVLENSAQTTIAKFSNPMTGICASPETGGSNCDGMLDEVKYWNRGLSSSEVLYDYQSSQNSCNPITNPLSCPSPSVSKNITYYEGFNPTINCSEYSLVWGSSCENNAVYDYHTCVNSCGDGTQILNEKFNITGYPIILEAEWTNNPSGNSYTYLGLKNDTNQGVSTLWQNTVGFSATGGFITDDYGNFLTTTECNHANNDNYPDPNYVKAVFYENGTIEMWMNGVKLCSKDTTMQSGKLNPFIMGHGGTKLDNLFATFHPTPTQSGFPYNITTYDTTGYFGTDNQGCVLYNGNIFCLNNPTKNLTRYNILTKTFDIVSSWNIDGYTMQPSWEYYCDVYQGEMYCSGTGGVSVFKINLDTYVASVLDETSGMLEETCKFRPNTDELWCYGWEDSSGISAFRYYDVSEDMWHEFNDNNRSLYVYLDNPACDFRTQDELWCGFGLTNTQMPTEIVKLNIPLNTTTYYDSLTFKMEYGHCRWYQDAFVCFGGDDDFLVTGKGLIFNLSTETFTTFENLFPSSYLTWSGCVEYDAYTDYCTAGYTDSDTWGVNLNVYKIVYVTAPITCSVCNETCSPCGGGCTATVLDNMYEGVTNFDATYGDITGWNTSCIQTMNYMFANSDFNQNIGGWDTSNVLEMSGMFRDNIYFNQDISGWNTGSCYAMDRMFSNATAFNQPIGTWDMSSMTDTNNMFNGAMSFDQDLSGWDITNFEQDALNGFFTGVTLSTQNYDNLLNSWGSQAIVNTQIPFDAGNSKYTTSGQVGRNLLINTYGWTILDGGLQLEPYCYQEQPDQSTNGCGYPYGTYYIDDANQDLYINYTKPANATSLSQWQMKFGDIYPPQIDFENVTILDTCLQTDVVSFRVQLRQYSINMACLNEFSQWATLNTWTTSMGESWQGGLDINSIDGDWATYSKAYLGGGRTTFFEEGVWWDVNVSEFPTCFEDWVTYNTTCTGGHNQLYYLDANQCGTYDNFPANNGTEQTCPTVKHEWTFDNWSLNDSIGSITGSKINAVSDETNCLRGECLTFNNYNGMGDANVQSVALSELPIPMDTRHNFSVRCAIKPQLNTGFGVFLANHYITIGGGASGFNLGTGSGGQLYLHNYGYQPSTANITLNPNQWYVVTFTYDADTFPYERIYVGGEEKALSGVSSDFQWGGNNLGTVAQFGTYYPLSYNGDLSFGGTLDECKYWDVRLSDQEVMDDFLTLPEVCVENWVEYNTSCSNSQKTLYYLDANECGTYEDLPLNNGTTSFCGLTLSSNLVNQSIHYYNPQNISWVGEVTGTPYVLYDCLVYIDGNEECVYPEIEDITQTQQCIYDWGDYEDYQYHTIRIYCENWESNDELTYDYIIDTIQPRIIPSEANATTYTKVLDPDPDYQVYFENMNLQETQVTLLDDGQNVLFDDHQYPVGSTNETVIVPINLMTMDAGQYSVEMYAKDLALERTKVYTFTIADCPEDWSPSYSACSVADEQVLTYEDLNQCGTFNNLPPDNGTISSCNYCTGSYTETIDNCVKIYDWNNYETCCGLTGLPSDCNIPANVTECVGMHTSEDVPAVTIDAIVEVGMEYVKYTPLLAIGGLAGYLLFLI